MARSILQIAQEAAERDKTAPAPAQLFGTNDRIARILRVAAKDTCRDLMRQTAWMGLSEFQSTWVLALEAGKYAYPLPEDYLRSIVNTEHRNGWPMGLIGPATPQVWSAWLANAQTVATPLGWRIRNNILFIDPTPTAAELVTMEYISRYLVVSEIEAGDYDASVPPNAISPTVPRDGVITGDASELVYEDTGSEFAYGAAPGWDAAVWAAELSDILKRINPLSLAAPAPQVRRAEFTADADKPAFEDDYVLSLGMTYRLRRALGKPYVEHAAEYEAELDTKIGTDAGHARPFHIGSRETIDDVVPLGGGTWMVS